MRTVFLAYFTFLEGVIRIYIFSRNVTIGLLTQSYNQVVFVKVFVILQRRMQQYRFFLNRYATV